MDSLTEQFAGGVHFCPFCQRIADGDYAATYLPSVVSFEPLNPVVPGHRLFVPREHVEHPSMLPLGTAMQCAELHARMEGWDYNLITSRGAAATMTVPHVHVHYVPRRTGDGLHLPWGVPD